MSETTAQRLDRMETEIEHLRAALHLTLVGVAPGLKWLDAKQANTVSVTSAQVKAARAKIQRHETQGRPKPSDAVYAIANAKRGKPCD